MRVDTAGRTIGGRIAVGGLIAALAGGLCWAPAAGAADHVAALEGTGTPKAETPETGIPAQGVPDGSSWTLRRTPPEEVPVRTTAATETGSGTVPTSVSGTAPGTASETVDTGLPVGSSWT